MGMPKPAMPPEVVALRKMQDLSAELHVMHDKIDKIAARMASNEYGQYSPPFGGITLHCTSKRD